MKFNWETALVIVAGLALVAITVYVMKQKTRGAARFIINSLAGGVLVAGLSAFNIIALPFNIFNAVLIGVLGLPGAGVVVAAAVLL